MMLTCKSCGKEAPHRMRADARTPRKSCNRCQADEARAWRKANWQRRKLRDTWRGMIRRCHQPYNRRWDYCPVAFAKWRDYGRLGIKVCDRWRGPDGFELFCQDMGPPPSPEHTLDRIRNSLGYMPCNTRWATPLEQASNRKNARWITATHPVTGQEETLTLSEWSRQTGVSPSTILKRLRKGATGTEAIAKRAEPAGVPF